MGAQMPVVFQDDEREQQARTLPGFQFFKNLAILWTVVYSLAGELGERLTFATAVSPATGVALAASLIIGNQN
jgi:hypothetical protein